MRCRGKDFLLWPWIHFTDLRILTELTIYLSSMSQLWIMKILKIIHSAQLKN